MIIDIIVLAVLLISAAVSFLRGFIREILTIFGVVGGVVAMIFVGPLLAPVVQGWLGGETAEGDEPQRLFNIIPYNLLADGLAYGGIFLVVVIVLSIVSHFLSEGAKGIGLGALDRILGILFGLVRGAILLLLLYSPFYLLLDEKDRTPWLESSKSGIYVERALKWSFSLLPEELTSSLEDKTEESRQSAMEATRQRLQEIDILRTGDEVMKKVAPVPDKKSESGSAYEKEDRQEINRLFSDTLQDLQEGTNE